MGIGHGRGWNRAHCKDGFEHLFNGNCQNSFHFSRWFILDQMKEAIFSRWRGLVGPDVFIMITFRIHCLEFILAALGKYESSGRSTELRQPENGEQISVVCHQFIPSLPPKIHNSSLENWTPTAWNRTSTVETFFLHSSEIKKYSTLRLIWPLWDTEFF